MKQRKVHRAFSRLAVTSACRARGAQPYLLDAQFAWLPEDRQCRICRASQPFPNQVSADAEMQTTVETIVLAIHRIGQHEHEHRCWFDGDRRFCTCGRESWLLDHEQESISELLGALWLGAHDVSATLFDFIDNAQCLRLARMAAA